MEEVKQSLQETASKERESYKSVFLKKRSVCIWYLRYTKNRRLKEGIITAI